MAATLKVAVLVSGGGRSLENLAIAITHHGIDAEIEEVISSDPGAYGLERARNLGLPATTIPRDRTGMSLEAFSRRVFEQLDRRGIDLVCLAGFLWKLAIPAPYRDRVLNIHPSLLPAFGGQGMYGHHVHEAVLAAGCKVSGCTVHFADRAYDEGPILIQRPCPVALNDTPTSLAARVFEQECIAYPEAVGLIAAGRVNVVDGLAEISPDNPGTPTAQ